MAEQGSVARPYARAVFEIASADGALQAWSDFLALGAAMASTPEVARMLSVPGADLGQLATAMAGLAREQLGNPALLRDAERSPGANFLKVLVANHRLGALPEISARFEALKAEAENALDVTLTTALAVSDEQRARVIEALGRRFGRQVRLTVNMDDKLLGGARLRVGDRVIDGSVRTGLEKLATALRA